MGLDLGNYALGFEKDDDVSIVNLTTRLGELVAASITIGSSSSTDLNILGNITVGGVVDGVDIAALSTTVAGLGAPAWSSITGTPTTISGYGITDGLTTDFNTNATASFTGTYLKLGAPGHFVVENLIQTGTNAGSDLTIKAGNASGTNQTGGNLKLGAGNSTGAVYSGDVSIWGNPRTTGGSLLNTSVEYATFTMNDAAPHLKFKETMKSIYGPDSNDFTVGSYQDLILQADYGLNSLSSEIKMKIQGAAWWSIDDVGRQYAGASLDLGAGPLITDATLTRLSAGDLGIEGNIIYRAGGTDVPIADGGTGASTLAAAKTALEIPVDLTVDGAGTVHANNYTDTNTTYSLATNTVSGLCQVYNTVEEESIVCEQAVDDRRYKIQHDTDLDLSVCIPWTDTQLTIGTGSGHAMAGNTSLLALGTSSTTALRGDTTTITPTQSGAITANTAKISYSTAASDAVALNTAKTTAHTLIDSDTMSGASATNVASAESVKAYVDAKYSYSYIMWHGRSSDSSTNWHFPDATTDGEFNWEDDDEAIAAWDGTNNGLDNNGTNTNAGTTTASIPRDIGVMGVVLPYDCTLVGFTGVGRDLAGNDPFKAGLWSSAAYSSYGGNTSNTTFTLQAVATATYAGGGGSNYNGICKLEDLTANYALSAGTILLPSLSESDASRHYITMTIVLKVPLV